MPGGHADSFVTSITLFLRPEAVRADQIITPPLPQQVDWHDPGLDLSQHSPTGVIGDPSQASAALGRRLWAEVVQTAAQAIYDTTIKPKGLTLEILEALLLGVIQGATEFLPISSSGHLLLVPSLLELDEPSLNMIAIAHLGTLLAVLVYFWSDLWQILLGVLDGLRRRQPMATENSRLGWYILAGTIPAAAAGLLLEDFFETVFGEPIIAAFMLLGTAALLVSGELLYSGSQTPG